MKAETKSNLSILLVSAFLTISASTANANPVDPEPCVACHQNMIDENIGKTSTHQPFMNGECILCHGDDDAAGQTRPAIEDSFTVKDSAERRIKWLEENEARANIQWFKVPAAEVKNALYIAAGDSKTTRLRLAVPESNSFSTLTDDSMPPAINDVQVVNIEKGLYISATISWKTDKISDSLVTFCTGDRNTSSYDGHLTTDHTVSLIGLKADQEYTYTVASTDVFGNESRSGSFTFSTRAAHLAAMDKPALTETGDVAMTGEIFTANGNLIIKVTSDRPAALAIGTDMRAMPNKESISTTGALDSVHGNVKININKTVALCIGCHKDHKGLGSHPVDVYPTRGMIIPADYPTSDDGKITCLTCHEAHASNLKYMLRKSHHRELCIGCHRDKDTGSPAQGLMVKITTRIPGNS